VITALPCRPHLSALDAEDAIRGSYADAVVVTTDTNLDPGTPAIVVTFRYAMQSARFMLPMLLQSAHHVNKQPELSFMPRRKTSQPALCILQASSGTQCPQPSAKF
jgi:hypothetical protein